MNLSMLEVCYSLVSSLRYSPSMAEVAVHSYSKYLLLYDFRCTQPMEEKDVHSY